MACDGFVAGAGVLGEGEGGEEGKKNPFVHGCDVKWSGVQLVSRKEESLEMLRVPWS